jgi:Outer membrane protein beta-barrel domain
MKYYLSLIGVFAGLASLGTEPTWAADVADNDLSFYLALSGGWSHQFDADFDVSGAPITGEIFFHDGWTGAVSLGAHVTDNLRAELEGAVHQVGLDSEDIVGIGTIDLEGHVRVYDVLAKLAYDFGDGPVKPFVAAGVGFASYGVDLDAPVSGSDSDTTFAGALEAGINYTVTPKAELFATGQVLVLGDVDLDPTSSGSATLSSPLLLSGSVGLRWNF